MRALWSTKVDSVDETAESWFCSAIGTTKSIQLIIDTAESRLGDVLRDLKG